MRNNFLEILTIILVIVGGLNWGLVGIFGFNLVEYLLGTGAIARTVYTLVGISAICTIFYTMREN